MFFNKKTVPAELIRLELPYFDRGSAIVRVYVPEHKKGEKLPVIYMTDGQSVFDEESNPLGCWHTREAVVAEKAASGKSAIIAGIHSDPNPMFRTADLTPASIGKFVPPPMPEGMPPMPEAMTPEIMEQMMKDFKPDGEKFDEFVIKTVMPAVEAQFPVKKGRAYTAFCGSSCGGVQTFYTVLSHPEKFSCGGVFSPAFPVYVPQDLEQWIRSHVPEDMPFLYCYGGGSDPLEHQISLSLESVFAVLQDCCPADKLHKVIAPDQPHHESAWQMVFKEFLTRFLEG